MHIDLEKINKLPPDVRKKWKINAIKSFRKKKESHIKSDFLSFVKHIWPEFIEGYHHKIIAEKFNNLASGKINRLIVNMPPRHTKSEFASYLLPAWMMGNYPKLKIIQATHTAELAVRFGRKTKNLIDSEEYKDLLIYPCSRIQKLRVVGKQTKAVNILPWVLKERLQAVVRIS